MTLVVVPIRYPLTAQSRATLATAHEVAETHDRVLAVLYVNGSPGGRRVSHDMLKHAVETALSPLPTARYASQSGLFVEETILEEVREQEADIVVIGTQQIGRVRRLLRRILGQPDIERLLRERIECENVLAPASSISAAS
jgi:nucleotide-binding universal stress UspA family protein